MNVLILFNHKISAITPEKNSVTGSPRVSSETHYFKHLHLILISTKELTNGWELLNNALFIIPIKLFVNYRKEITIM